MGFRTYIGKMSKKEAKRLKSASIHELSIEHYEGEDPYSLGPYEIAENVYELGKYVELEVETYRLFGDDQVEQYYNSDYLMVGLTKKGFADIINMYRKDIAKYYKELYDGYFVVGVDQSKVENHLRSMTSEWNNEYTNPVDLNDDNEEVTRSWKYEYAIFEMVRLYKLFDWDNDIAVVYGY